ncbi:MAG: cytochrome c biogenesis protein CcdA [Candidatus Omnitrophota bacterium]
MLYHFLPELDKLFHSSSPLLGLVISFFAGIVASFSPCLWPLIPITLGIVGVTAATSRLKGFFISIIFVSGIAVFNTILGIFAASLGIFLNKFFNNPVTYIFLGILFFILGLSFLGILKISLFSLSYNYTPKETMQSVFILGFISGLANIPCNFPVLGSILSLVSLKKDVVYAAAALFIFSLGYGTILVILGTFTSLISKLPKESKWLLVIRKIMGIGILGMGIYFITKCIMLIR